MRRVRYSVVMSLDGYISGPKGEADWIIMDPEGDFGAYFEQFDTFLLGRRTFEAMGRAGQAGAPGTKTFVFSRTLRQEDYPGVTIVAEGAEETVAALRRGRTSGCSVAARSSALCSTRGWWTRWRLASCPFYSAGVSRCSPSRPRRRS